MTDLSGLTDGREPYDWKSKYPPEALKRIFLEGCYLLALFFLSVTMIVGTWKGWFTSGCQASESQRAISESYLFYASSGMLGGITFGMKYFYRVVARGYWHIDRLPWRIMSPFIATAVAFIVGLMVEASLISSPASMTPAAVISIGFLAGYFADEAVGKMYEIAQVLFGKTTVAKALNDKEPKK